MKLHPRLTAEGVLLARRAERFRPVAERDGRGWVVGYGHRTGAREGVRVSDADAMALLAHDLSQSAARVEPLLLRPVPPELFDTLNAYALRVGPEAFARSEVLRRANGFPFAADGEGAGPDSGPPSAVLAAAESVRDRVSQVLDSPTPPPAPRPRREPWPEPPAPAIEPLVQTAPPGEDRPPGDAPRRPDDQDGAASPPAAAHPIPGPDRDGGRGDAADSDELSALAREAGPPELHAPAAPLPDTAPASANEPAARDRVFPEVVAAPSDRPMPAVPPPSASAPLVSFERGGRARPWDRVRANPYVYMAVGACGLALFACALLGFLLGRPTAMGLALGVVGVICLAPALAFFLHRRGGPPS